MCLLYFVHKIVRPYLSVVQVLLSFAAPPKFYCDFPIRKLKSVGRKTTTSKSTQVYNLKLLWSLKGKAKIANVIRHTRSCLSINLAAICFYLINQPCASYIAFDKCFYNCDIVAEKSLYILFLIHKKQFAFQVYA